MKYWLIRLYPRSWRRRYETEFRALLDQHTLNVWDVADIVRGALDAHLIAIRTQQEPRMYTLTFTLHRRTVMPFLIALLGYILSYGACRAEGILVHTTQNRYTPISQHTITEGGVNFSRPTAPLALFYIPLRLVESAAWPLIDDVTHEP